MPFAQNGLRRRLAFEDSPSSWASAYLSQVEQCNVVPPAAHRIARMAELLDVCPDEWMALAGRVSDDVGKLIAEHSTEMSRLLRALQGLSAKHIRALRVMAEQLKDDTGKG